MNDNLIKALFNPFVLVAFFSGLASVLIAFLCVMTISNGKYTDAAMFAFAAMVAAPAVMGIGVAYFASEHERRP